MNNGFVELNNNELHSTNGGGLGEVLLEIYRDFGNMLHMFFGCMNCGLKSPLSSPVKSATGGGGSGGSSSLGNGSNTTVHSRTM